MARSKAKPAVFEVTVKNWHAVANWTWDAGDDVCGICRMPFDGCVPSWAAAKCQRAEHLHCTESRPAFPVYANSCRARSMLNAGPLAWLMYHSAAAGVALLTTSRDISAGSEHYLAVVI